MTGPDAKDGETMSLSMTPRRGVVALVTLGLLAAGTVAATPAVAAPLLGADCAPPTGAVVKDLYAGVGSMPVPGVTGDVPVWSYTSDGSTPVRAAGPTLTVAQGNVVVVKVHNNLGRPTSLAIPQLDGRLETGTDTTGALCFAFTASRPGTFVYEADGSADAARQVAMGMVGALVVQSSVAGTAYGTGTGSDFAVESVLLVSDVDPALNQSADPTTFDMRQYTPRASLINGRPYPATTPVLAAAGNRVLLRIVNAAVVPHSLGVLGLTEHVVGQSSRALAQPYDVAVENLSAGDTLDAIVTLPTTGGPKYTVYDASTRLDNNGERTSTSVYAQVKFGGALTFIDTGGSAPTPGGPTLSGLATSPSRTNGTAAHPMSFSATVAGTATGGEYFFDDSTKPVGSGTSFTISGASISQAVDLAQLAALASGSHTLFVRATDGSTWGPVSSASFTVDKSGPVVGSLTVAPAAVNAAAISVQASATDVGGGLVTGGTYAVDGTGTSGPLAVSPTGGAPSVSMTGTIPETAVQSLAEGKHFVTATASDDFGTAGPAGPGTGTLLLVDRTGPTTGTVTVTPSPNDGTQGVSYDTNSVEVRASFSEPLAADGSASGVVGGEGFIDPAGSPTPGTGFPLTAYAGSQQQLVGTFPVSLMTQLADGTHQVVVRAKDAAGNWGPTSSGTLVINRTPPLFADGFDETSLPGPWASVTTTNGATAALSSSRLLTTVGGTTNNARNNSTAFVTTPSWAGVGTVNTQFQFDRSTLVTGASTRWVTVLQARQGTTTRFQVQFSHASTTGNGTLRLVVTRAGGTSTVTSSVPITAGTHTVRVVWAATLSNTVPATVSLVVDGTTSSVNVNTFGYTVTQADLGLVATTGSGSGSKSGASAFDSFVATRYPLP